MKTKKLLSIILSMVIVLGMWVFPVSAESNEIVHKIAEKYSGENLVDDPNMMWFVADLSVYEHVYQQNIITPVIKQKCLDKIIAEADAAAYPSAIAKTIISLRALGYDAKNVITADLTEINVVKKLTDLVDLGEASVLNEYTLPYVILALQQGNNYATAEQMDYLLTKAVETKSAWQDTTWGTDAATPMLLALAPYYNTNVQVKNAIDETLPIVTSFQNETGLISNAASHGLAMAAFSAPEIDNHSVISNGNDMFAGLMTEATPENDGFEPSYNSFSTEQGFRGILSTMLPAGTRIYDFANYPYNQAVATWAEFAPVTFEVTPADAVVTINDVLPVANNKFDLREGTYNYSVAHSVYQKADGVVTITPEEAQNHIPKTIKVVLGSQSQSSGGISSDIKIKIKVMSHNKSECNNSFTYKNNSSLYKSLINETLSVKRGSSVLDALKKALDKNNIGYVENNGYVSEIDGVKEFEHGNNSGWMFTVDNKHQTKSASETKLSNGQEIIWFYTDNYMDEKGSDNFKPSSQNNKKPEKTWGLEGKNPDIKKREIELKGKTFEDIKNHKNKPVIEALAERKIINGKSDKHFDPDGYMTRSEFATIIVNGLCLPMKNGKEFKDVLSTDWFYNYISTAYAYGIINGVSDAEFNPNGTITREQAVVMLARTAKLCGLDTEISAEGVRNILAEFIDYTTASDWAKSSLAFCYSKKILSNEALEIKPLEYVTRAEIANLLYNMLSVVKLL